MNDYMIDDEEERYKPEYIEAYLANRSGVAQSIEEWTAEEGAHLFIASNIYQPITASVAIKGVSNNAFAVDMTRADWHPQLITAVKSALVAHKAATPTDTVILTDIRGDPITDLTMHDMKQVGVLYPSVNGVRIGSRLSGEQAKTPATHALNRDAMLAEWAQKACAVGVRVIATQIAEASDAIDLDNRLFSDETHEAIASAIESMDSHLPSFEKLIEVHADATAMADMSRGELTASDISDDIASQMLDEVATSFQAHAEDVTAFYRMRDMQKKQTMATTPKSRSMFSSNAVEAIETSFDALIAEFPTTAKLHETVLERALIGNEGLVQNIIACAVCGPHKNRHGRRRGRGRGRKSAGKKHSHSVHHTFDHSPAEHREKYHNPHHHHHHAASEKRAIRPYRAALKGDPERMERVRRYTAMMRRRPAPPGIFAAAAAPEDTPKVEVIESRLPHGGSGVPGSKYATGSHPPTFRARSKQDDAEADGGKGTIWHQLGIGSAAPDGPPGMDMFTSSSESLALKAQGPPPLQDKYIGNDMADGDDEEDIGDEYIGSEEDEDEQVANEYIEARADAAELDREWQNYVQNVNPGLKGQRLFASAKRRILKRYNTEQMKVAAKKKAANQKVALATAKAKVRAGTILLDEVESEHVGSEALSVEEVAMRAYIARRHQEEKIAPVAVIQQQQKQEPIQTHMSGRHLASMRAREKASASVRGASSAKKPMPALGGRGINAPVAAAAPAPASIESRLPTVPRRR